MKLSVKTEAQNITAFRLELLTDPTLPLGGPGRSPKGISALTEFTVEAAPTDAPTKITQLKFVKATSDFEPPARPLDPILNDKTGKYITGPAEFAIDGKEETAWGIDAGPGLRNQSRKAVFTLAAPISYPQGTILTIHLSQNHGGSATDENQNNTMGRFRLSITSAPNATADPLPKDVRDILSIPASERTPLQVQTVFGYWRTTVPEWKAQNEEIAEIWKGYPEGSAQLVFQTRPGGRETHVLTRGDFLKPTKLVEPGVRRSCLRSPRMIPGRTASPPASLSRDGSRREIPPPRRAPLSIACGRLTLESASWRPARILARRVNRLPIRNCSIGWRSISWIKVGA